MGVIHFVTAERTELAALLATLTPEEWTTPSLCDGWLVRDVAAHIVSYDDLGTAELVRRYVRGRFSVSRLNELVLDEFRGLSDDDIARLVEARVVPRGLTSWFGGSIGLADGMIHQQDIRRPLGRPREIPAERLAAALAMGTKALLVRGPQNSRGIHMTATDVGWSHGSGPEVSGPGEALLMAIAGRPAALDDLEGPGVEVLARKIRR